MSGSSGSASTISSSTTPFSTTPTSTTPVSTSLADASQTGTGQASVSEVSTTQSNATQASVSQSSASTSQATHSASAAKSGSSGLSGGAAAGVAIGALIIGALIASAVFIMLQKRQRRQRSQRSSALGAMSTGNRPDEKSARAAVDVVPQTDTFDLDRLLPQPFDDSKIKGEVNLLLTQIDGHVENFYTEDNVSSKTRVSTDASEAEMLIYPRTRFFALKRLICLAMIEAISLDCPSEQSLLPLGFGTITRQLKQVNLDDQANGLSWARLRSSIGYLLKSDLGAEEQKRVDRAIGATVARLNAQTQAFELAGTSNERAADLDAICRSSAVLGRLLLSQPAEWKFDWRGTSNAPAAGSRSQLVYFPSLARLTDNKGKRLRTPHVAITAKSTSV